MDEVTLQKLRDVLALLVRPCQLCGGLVEARHDVKAAEHSAACKNCGAVHAFWSEGFFDA